MSHALEVSGLTVRFGGLEALGDVSFAIEEGATTALIGPNGAGKTTCLNVVSGLQRATAGSVHYQGRDVTALAPHKRRYLGRTFQIAEPFAGMTVEESVQVGVEARGRIGLGRAALRIGTRRRERSSRERASELIERMGLGPVASRLVETLPLGHQRVVEFARALAQDPELLLLDEAASGLSGSEMEQLAGHVLACRDEGRTVVLIEHNMRFVTRLARHLLVLDRGKLLYDGETAAGLRDPAVVSAYLGGSDGAA